MRHMGWEAEGAFVIWKWTHDYFHLCFYPTASKSGDPRLAGQDGGDAPTRLLQGGTPALRFPSSLVGDFFSCYPLPFVGGTQLIQKKPYFEQTV